LLATTEPVYFAEDQHKSQRRRAPTPGWVIRCCVWGHFSASSSIACVNSAIVGLRRSNKSSRSCRRRLAQGANGKDKVVSDFAQKNLFTIDLSHVLRDLVQVDDRPQRMLRYSPETFLGMDEKNEDAA
jgi:hypothetical protein